MNQPDLFAEPSDCERGHHAATIDDAPDIHDNYVNVEHRCPCCRQSIAVTSWTREAWERAKVDPMKART